jgi:polyphosphate kinase
MIKDNKGYLYKDREISWMLFNERVLQEAENEQTPLLERLKFLAIFSSNNDEFFRVRVAILLRNQKLNKKSPIQFPPQVILSEVQRMAVIQSDRFNKAYERIIRRLNDNNIFIRNENELTEEQKATVVDYARRDVMPYLFPVILDNQKHVPHLRDRSIYLAVRMSDSKGLIKPQHAIIEIPQSPLKRFYSLPESGGQTNIMFLDDVIRTSLKRIFNIFDYDEFEAYTIKLTRDAEFTLGDDDADDDYRKGLLEKLQRSLKQRSKGAPTRFVYDAAMPRPMLELLLDRLQMRNVNLIAGGRYHNFKDFMDFPKVGRNSDYFSPMPPIAIPELDNSRTMFSAITGRDYFVSHPYQSFDYLIRMLREAAIDPNVETIKITLYRVAKHSNVVNALINAVKNGKKVTVLMELQARFDEEHNIYWTNQLQEAGARVYFGKPGQKVHTKICLITRDENGKTVKYAHLSTGNYNGVTSRLYCDHGLFTKDTRYTSDLEKLMNNLFGTPKKVKYEHLLVAPDNMAKRFEELIDKEIVNAKAGRKAYIIAKMNSLLDEGLIKKLYDASKAGVKIDLIIRGICSIVPGIPGLSSNIRVISILDRFLEHARVYIFANGGDETTYLASADWMTRNLHNRIECGFPVYDEGIKKELRDIINIQLNDNMKARLIDSDFDNKYVSLDGPAIRAQYAIYEYLKQKYMGA